MDWEKFWQWAELQTKVGIYQSKALVWQGMILLGIVIFLVIDAWRGC